MNDNFNDIKDLFLNKKGYFSRLIQFKVILIILVVIVFFIYYFKKTYPYIIILIIFAVYIGNSYIIVQNSNTSDFNTQTMIKLNELQSKMYNYIDTQVKKMNKERSGTVTKNEIQKMYDDSKLDNLYVDANLIHFLDSITILYNYNSNEFYLLLKGIDNILKIRNEIEYFYSENNTPPKNIPDLLETAIDLKSKTLNNLHNFIYKVPNTNVMYDYTNKVVNRFHVLVSRNVDIIYKYYKEFNETNPINNSTRFISYDKTKPFDSSLNHSVIVSKNNNSLIPFWL